MSRRKTRQRNIKRIESLLATLNVQPLPGFRDKVFERIAQCPLPQRQPRFQKERKVKKGLLLSLMDFFFFHPYILQTFLSTYIVVVFIFTSMDINHFSYRVILT